MTNVPVAFGAYITPKSIELFKSARVLSEKELHSRYEVKDEIFLKKVQI